MKTTEESIVYQLLSSIRAGELANDEVITERRIRSFLRTHRANEIFKAFDKGAQISDQCFQKVELNLVRFGKIEWESPIPQIIQLPNNFGVKFMTPGFTNISVLDEENYHLSKFSPVNRFLPVAKIENGKLLLRVPGPSPYAMNYGRGSAILTACLDANIAKAVISVVLEDPDDGIGYDWTTSPYPISPENIQTLKDNILRKEFQMILGTKADQVPNTKNDILRNNDQGTVQQ